MYYDVSVNVTGQTVCGCLCKYIKYSCSACVYTTKTSKTTHRHTTHTDRRLLKNRSDRHTHTHWKTHHMHTQTLSLGTWHQKARPCERIWYKPVALYWNRGTASCRKQILCTCTWAAFRWKQLKELALWEKNVGAWYGRVVCATQASKGTCWCVWSVLLPGANYYKLTTVITLDIV